MRVAIAAALVLFAACDGGSPATSGPPVDPYSCQASLPGANGAPATLLLCLDVSGGTAQDFQNNRNKCEMDGNTFVLGPCPHAGALGGCREVAPGIVLTSWYYDDGSSSASDIQMLCEGLAGAGLPGVQITFVTP